MTAVTIIISYLSVLFLGINIGLSIFKKQLNELVKISNTKDKVFKEINDNWTEFCKNLNTKWYKRCEELLEQNTQLKKEIAERNNNE